MYVPSIEDLDNRVDKHSNSYRYMGNRSSQWETHAYTSTNIYHRESDNTYWGVAYVRNITTGKAIGLVNEKSPVTRVTHEQDYLLSS